MKTFSGQHKQTWGIDKHGNIAMQEDFTSIISFPVQAQGEKITVSNKNTLPTIRITEA